MLPPKLPRQLTNKKMNLTTENSRDLSGVLKAAKSYSEALAVRDGKLNTYEAENLALVLHHIPGIRFAERKLEELRAPLSRALEAAKSAFEPPHARTFSVFGLKLGFRKGSGRTTFEDPEAVIDRIRKHCPDQLDTLAPEVRLLDKDALAQLPAALLKKLGVEIEGTGDQLVLKPMDSDLRKLAAQLLQLAEKAEVAS
jgi:hypothetical protein